MKRTLALGVVAAVAAGIMAAPAASAQPQFICSANKVPPQTVVAVGGEEIKVYPANAAPWAGAVVDWATGVARCLVNAAAGPTIACVKGIVANRPTVTIDPQTLEITIHYGDLLGTSCTT